jgi:hypothetical protein
VLFAPEQQDRPIARYGQDYSLAVFGQKEGVMSQRTFTTLTALMQHGQAARQLLCMGHWPVTPLANCTYVPSQSGIFLMQLSNADQVGAPLCAQVPAADGSVA